MWKSNCRGTFTAASSPRNDLVKNYRVHPTHWLISTQVDVSESFTYIARGAIYLVTDKLRDIRIKFGFVVEGRERDERCRNQNS